MAEFKEVMKQRDRMCKQFSMCCNCPISTVNNSTHDDCNTYVGHHPQEAEEIIMKWAEEHPIKSNADKFYEVFGFLPSVYCPHDWINDFCGSCEHKTFWNQEYKEPDKEKKND